MTISTPPDIAWLNNDTRAAIGAGNTPALLHTIGTLARQWMNAAGLAVDHYPAITRSDIAGCLRKHQPPQPDAVQRAFLAAACDVLDVLSLSPEGRQTIQNLSLQPVTQHAKGK